MLKGLQASWEVVEGSVNCKDFHWETSFAVVWYTTSVSRIIQRHPQWNYWIYVKEKSSLTFKYGSLQEIDILPLMSLMMKITCWGILQVIVQVLLTQVMMKVKNSQTRRKPTQILLRFSEIQSKVWGIVQYCWWQFSSQQCKWFRKALKQRPEV